mmetsp:Transcript_71700/g.149849  ORF Transcript_71700/g.149849 Transcript_71700/m.149849 type:complete len:323 (-) Transcript_71700:135-1103(-)|eukprot:CAMPEP_0206457838 /NCGR_PEP_ID=MMETSP0324_2-20121206/23206_1 /ASSEMBLY_ACC=CAM_ASM_000836 /TAXON_ID=2866 /ORGANISM="Crypthecodinium cohnii, Strain Seligo" /LENGTH=322 /DNA_ID=CAMNT_0053929049 /DNA_START=69 /DNA_END=1037 /DNA_ORIENTATION=-
MAPAAAKGNKAPLPTVDPQIFTAYLQEKGLPENGSVPAYLKAEGPSEVSHPLHSISYRFLEKCGVAIAAFNEPKSLHSLSPTQKMETFMILEHVRRDPKVKALVWTSTGVRAFSSGAALKGDDTIHVDKEIVKAYRARGLAQEPGDWVLAAETKAFWDCPKPVIMAVNGMAVGGGANIALANFADVVFASKTAKFTYPFAKLGITPELGSSLVIPFVVGMSKAKEIMLGGEWFSADEAKQMGLVSDVLAPEALLPHAVNFAIKVAANHPETNRLIKKVMNAPLREKLDQVLGRELVIFEEALSKGPGAATFGKKSPPKQSKL